MLSFAEASRDVLGKPPADNYVLGTWYCCILQGPGKRAAVFSHDKLLWELCDDALEAARLQNGALLDPAGCKHLSCCPQAWSS